MTNKNIILIIISVLIVVGIMIYFLSQQNVTNTSYNPQTQGKLILGITDVAASMGNVTSVLVTVDKVELHSSTSGWITVFTGTKQYNLLELKQFETMSLLANTNVDAGTYDQVKLTISKAVVVENGIQKEAKLPSSELKVLTNIVVNADKTSTVVFDFMADKSLHITGNGKIIFAPVIKIKKHSQADVEIKSNDEIKIVGKDEEIDEDVGMDEKGEVKNNFELKGELDIDEKNQIKIKANLQNSIIFNLTAQNNSKVSGTATLSQEKDRKIKVFLQLNQSAPKIPQAASIQVGNCFNPGKIKFPLNNVINGKSETTIDVSMDNLKSSLPLVINVNKSSANSNVQVACNDINF